MPRGRRGRSAISLRKPALNALKCLDHEMGGGVRVITEVLVKGTGIVSLYAGVKDHMRQSLSPSPCFGRSHQQRSDPGPAEISVDNQGLNNRLTRLFQSRPFINMN